MAKTWVTIFSSSDSYEVAVTQGLLESAGIPVMALGGLNDLFPGTQRVTLKVPSDQAGMANEVIHSAPLIELDDDE